MSRMEAFEKPFFEPLWRRIALVATGLVLGLVLFAFGFSATGLVLCASAFWLGYELLIVFDVDTGRRKKQPEREAP